MGCDIVLQAHLKCHPSKFRELCSNNRHHHNTFHSQITKQSQCSTVIISIATLQWEGLKDI